MGIEQWEEETPRESDFEGQLELYCRNFIVLWKTENLLLEDVHKVSYELRPREKICCFSVTNLCLTLL